MNDLGISLSIYLHGDGALGKHIGSAPFSMGTLHAVSALDAGMQSGKPSVALLVKGEHGEFVIAETSLALFLSAADAFRAAHGDPRKEWDGNGKVGNT